MGAVRRMITAAAIGCALAIPATASAATEQPRDSEPCLLLVHDIARDTASWNTAVDRLHRQGRCAVAVPWGVPQGTDVPLPLAGLRGAEDGADDLAESIDRLGPGPFDVIAHGAGSLAVQRYLQKYGSASVRSLTTLGPLWNGTGIGGLAAAEDVSRALGTYDLVLTLEKPIVDPVCAGCRELISGSDLLRDLHRLGVPTAGVRYTDIATPCDELAPPSALPGAALIVLDHCTSHFTLPDDPSALAAAFGR